MFEYDQEVSDAVKILDKYDLKPVLNDCYDSGDRHPYDIRDKAVENFPEIEDALECLCEDEWMEYLIKRYNVRFRETISYQLQI